MKKITHCRMCGRGIIQPKVFCTKNCEEHWDLGFRLKYDHYDDFVVRDWIVVVGNTKMPTGSKVLC